MGPRGISDATIIKPMYIETDDEPWHSTCRPINLPSKGELKAGFDNMLPFVAPELELDETLRKAGDAKTVEEAVEKALKAGARKGSPSLNAADKMLGLFEKGDEKGAKKAAPKAPKAPGPNGKGWDDMERKIGKTHDNSVS